jgi:hypothetical protein
MSSRARRDSSPREEAELPEELPRHQRGLSVQATDPMVEPAHRLGVDLAGEPVQGAAECGVTLQGDPVDERDGLTDPIQVRRSNVPRP